jgi:hypothetical protein
MAIRKSRFFVFPGPSEARSPESIISTAFGSASFKKLAGK